MYHIFVSTYNYDGGEVKFLRARGYDAFKMKGPALRLLPFLQLPTRRFIRCASRNSKADNKILQFRPMLFKIQFRYFIGHKKIQEWSVPNERKKILGRFKSGKVVGRE